jgi:hypothetical protein
MSQLVHRDSKGVKDFQRPVGLFILLLVFGGLVHSGLSPSREMEEMLGFDIETLSAAPVSPGHFSISIASPIHGHEDPLNSEGDDDDCLCWCGQVLASEVFDMASPSQAFARSDPEDTFLPSVPLRLLFHPPRLA